MRTWPALLLAPLLALAQQSICLSLTRHACHQQTTLALNVVSGMTLLAILAVTALAASAWRSTRAATDRPAGAAQREDTRSGRRPHFLAVAATLMGTLSALVSLLMWMPVWVLVPCAS
jgi:hypothetical protein